MAGKAETVLITGISGFVGSHLCEEFLRRGLKVKGLIPEGEDISNLAAAESEIRLLQGDLLDPAGLERIVEEAGADLIVHLAAESSPARSYLDPVISFEVNTLGTLHLLEAIRKAKRPRRFLLFTSAEVYGAADPAAMPLAESAPLRPLNPYAASKAACHYLGQQYAAHHGLPLVEVRPFNMIGPRQGRGFVLPDFASQVAVIVSGRAEPRIHVGRLSDRRDFLDVRDAVRAIAELAERGSDGEVYHVCSGVATPVRRLLDLLLEAAGVEIEVVRDPARLRPTATPILLGSNTKLTEQTGWGPTITLEDTVRDALEYWLGKSSAGDNN